MNILDRFQEAFKTPLGDLLIFLVVAALTLSFFYLYFWAKFKKSRLLLLKYHLEFKRVEKQLKEITFLEMGQADFWGKSQIVTFADGKFGKSLIFYPELSTEDTIHRFRNYHLALQQADTEYFPKNKFFVQNNLLVDVETQYIKRDGKSLINLAYLCSEPTFTTSEKELFLIDLAHTLEALHQIQTEEGKALYHGFLLPQSFYLTLDLVKKITHTYLAYHGCSFALGPELFTQWLQNVLKGHLAIDSQVKKELERFLFILAPEQKILSSTREVSFQTDFYSFGALAAYFFTNKSFQEVKNVNFDQIPSEWRVFVRECLNENPLDRPQNFLELKEYFAQPEIELGQSYSYSEALVGNSKTPEESGSLKPFFDQVHKTRGEEAYFNETWHKGYQAIHSESWDIAFNIFQEMMKEDPQAFNAHLGLALTYFKKGDQDKAKYHYLQAKKIDGKKISSFHRLIAFDI